MPDKSNYMQGDRDTLFFALAIWRTGSYNNCNKVEDTMSRGTAIYSEKGKNG